MRRTQPGLVASAFIEAFPLVADLATKSETFVEIVKVPAPEGDEDRRDRFAARANSILAFVECSEQLRPKLRDAIVEAMLWAQKQP